MRLYCIFTASVLFAASSLSAQDASLQAPLNPSPANAQANHQASTSQFQSGTVATTSYAAISLQRAASQELQVQVSVAYLMVDDQTRETIYGEIGDQNVKTTTRDVPTSNRELLPTPADSFATSSRSIRTTSCVSTSVLAEPARLSIYSHVDSSAVSRVINAPRIVLVDGEESEMNDIHQRPFVVGLLQTPSTDQAKPSDAMEDQPQVQVLDEGTAVRIAARQISEQRVHLAARIKKMKVTEAKTTRVFGLGEGEIVLQSPVHRIETATAAQELSIGETLMIDPYISDTIEVQVERGVPMFGKIPYVKNAFTNVATGKQKLHWIVVIRVQDAT